MPRDLTLETMPTLEHVQANNSPPPSESSTESNMFNRTSTSLVDDRFKRLTELRPYSLLLNHTDLADCDWLEHAAFDPSEAASSEKLEYRLRTCGELCSGLFTSAFATTPGPVGNIIKTRQFPSVDSAASDRKRVLIGHIIATKSKSNLVTDDSMAFPSDWRTNYLLGPSSGHHEDGETVCLHSLCVHPDFHRKGLGAVLLKAWTQRIKDSGVAKRVALICRERLVAWYEKAGFKKVGPSACQFGGGNWIDMVMEFDGSVSADDF